MRKHELRIIEENLIKKSDSFGNGEDWQPWQLGSWKCLRERAAEILYQGPDIKINRKIPKPFFILSEDYIGLIIDPKVEADSGLDLLIIPHHHKTAPPIVSLTYSVDVWSLELLLVFKRIKFNLVSGQPLAEVMLLPRSETVVKKVFGEEENKIINNRKKLTESRNEITRKVDFSGTKLDNYYEIVKRKVKTPPRTNPLIFPRGYE